MALTLRGANVLERLLQYHLGSKAEIAAAFSVGLKVVSTWAREGAPIFVAGKRWQCCYFSLVSWLEIHRSVPDRSTVEAQK